MSIEVTYEKLRFAVNAKRPEGDGEWSQPLELLAGGEWAVPEDGFNFPEWIGLAATTTLANPHKGVELPPRLRRRPASEVAVYMRNLLRSDGLKVDPRTTYNFLVNGTGLSIDEIEAGSKYRVELYSERFLGNRTEVEAYAYRVNETGLCKKVRIEEAYGDPGAWQVVVELLPRNAKDTVRFGVYERFASLLSSS